MVKPFVLIIEDERDIAALFRHVVDMVGYRTEIALSGQVASDRLSNSQPDIVILDLNLPGVSGEELLKKIHNDKRLAQTKTIVVTAHAHIADTLPVEPDLILLKPVSIEQLSIFIRRFGVLEKAQKELNPWDKNTGLYNQSFFMNRLDSSLKQSKENDQYLFAILSFKLSQIYNLKKLLDIKLWESTLGEIVKSLKSTVRPTDTIASIDQDNFYILIENMPNKDTPAMVATRLEEMLDENLGDVGDKGQNPIGITFCDSRYESSDEILRDAKNAQSLIQ
ncbi:MAG: response regulator [Anaerolineae bacterium]|jgi:PleD family two-component response regulator|nr:response regulator [Anaerolineae bacterium]MBT3713093.1 response regulator [Anaerolineae bacterium]MBT4309494.1 response regulator [Anaerolineae bacterium]MBT4457270.1 response regulator [Anaerolineae bacterium]MBT4843023.1 response regulator [Anaerolineae bacterium]